MEADEDVAPPGDLPLHERHVLFARERADERVDPEVSVARREAGLASEEHVAAQVAFGTRHEPAVPTAPAYIRMHVRPATTEAFPPRPPHSTRLRVRLTAIL